MSSLVSEVLALHLIFSAMGGDILVIGGKSESYFFYRTSSSCLVLPVRLDRLIHLE